MTVSCSPVKCGSGRFGRFNWLGIRGQRKDETARLAVPTGAGLNGPKVDSPHPDTNVTHKFLNFSSGIGRPATSILPEDVVLYLNSVYIILYI